MGKPEYELARNKRVKDIQDVFNSLGITVLAETVREGMSKKPKKGKGKSVESELPESDIDYEPTADNAMQSDTSDDDDDLVNEVNIEVTKMVPGTRTQQKKQKAAANQEPPRTPIYTRQTAARLSPGANPHAGRPPPRPRGNLQTKKNLTPSLNQNPTSSSIQPTTSATNTTSTMPSTPNVTMANATNSLPCPSIVHSPPRVTRLSAALSAPFTFTVPPTRPTGNISESPTPTNSVHLATPTDDSPGGRSSRQSNDINVSGQHLDSATSEGQTTEGEPADHSVAAPEKRKRGLTMGHGLEKLTARGKKLAIHVAEGKKRPEVPLQAAKLASECGVAVRDGLPVYKSWKDYNAEAEQKKVSKVLSFVASRLEVDVKNDGPSKAACTDIIKKALKQQRYHLKRKYYDSSLSKEQLLARDPPGKMKKEDWTNLVEYWCEPHNQEKSAKNKINRGKVQLHQKTGSRSYIAHRYSLRPKYNNMEPDPVDFFGECMTSPRSGRSPLANEIYEHMVQEKERDQEEGEEQKSPCKIVADSLSQISRSSTFLPNIGVARGSKTLSSTSKATEARLQAQFEATLQQEREEAARKQEALQAQLQAQQAALEENQNLLRQTQEEVKGMNTKFEETNALLRAMLNIQKG